MESLEYYYGVESLFENDFKDGEAYYKRALQFRDAAQPHSLVFNVASVALERYLVALCELHGEEPMNHNFITLMITVDKLMPVPRELSKQVKSLDQIFGICFLEDYYHGTPEIADAERVLKMCEDVKKLFDQEKMASVLNAIKEFQYAS